MSSYRLSVFSYWTSYFMNGSSNGVLVSDKVCSNCDSYTLSLRELYYTEQSSIYPLVYLIMENNILRCHNILIHSNDKLLHNLNKNIKSGNFSRRSKEARLYNLTCLLYEVFSLHNQLFWYHKQYTPFNLRKELLYNSIVELKDGDKSYSFNTNTDAILLLSALKLNEILLSFHYSYINKLISSIQDLNESFKSIFNQFRFNIQTISCNSTSNKHTVNMSSDFQKLRNSYIHERGKGYSTDFLIDFAFLWLDCDVISFLYSVWLDLLSNNKQVGAVIARDKLFSIDVINNVKDFNNKDVLEEFLSCSRSEKDKSFIRDILELSRQLDYIQSFN